MIVKENRPYRQYQKPYDIHRRLQRVTGIEIHLFPEYAEKQPSENELKESCSDKAADHSNQSPRNEDSIISF